MQKDSSGSAMEGVPQMSLLSFLLGVDALGLK